MTETTPKSRSRLVLAAVVIVAVLAAAGIGAWFYLSARESTDDAQVDGHIHPVNAKVGGTVTKINVKENQQVEAGAVLVQIDSRDYDVALSRAEADLADAQAEYEAAKAALPVVSTETGSRVSSAQAAIERAQGGVQSAQKDVDTAKARLNLAKARAGEAQANYTRASKDLERLKPLIVKDEVSHQQYDAVVATADAAKAAVDSAEAGIREAESAVAAAEARVIQARGSFGQAEAEAQAANSGPQQVASTRARIQAAAARIDQAKATLNQAKLNIEYATIKAPVSGIVSRRTVEVGQVVQPGQPMLAVVSFDEIWITANFKETQLDKMKPGQNASISVDAYDGQKFSGKVESIAAATGAKFSLLPPENASGNYVKVVQRIPVRIEVDRNADPQHLLRPGMSVIATVSTEQ
jgi:membrane fusion protein (multidrug efflux system)